MSSTVTKMLRADKALTFLTVPRFCQCSCAPAEKLLVMLEGLDNV